ncbi:MAG: peptide deformylase [Micrococcales bacterium]|jgi:peptide deformylase|nr:peptide deformylase [Micrococcales bacterium]
MAVREIRLFGDPVLKTPCSAVLDFDEKTIALVTDLLDTTKVPGRAGVAAPQIGVNLRVFSYHVNGVSGYLINPEKLELAGDAELVEEGCLSVPGLWHKTLRHSKASLSGYQLDGSYRTIHGEGLLAQALQHELDHLDGLLYLDRLSHEERREAMKTLRQTEWFMS